MSSYGSVTPTLSKPGEDGDNNQTSEKTPLIVLPEEEEEEMMKENGGGATTSGNTTTSTTNRSIWSKLTFQWFTSILHRGNVNNRLNQEDLQLIPLPNDCMTQDIMSTFDEYWSKELDKLKKKGKKGMSGATTQPSLVIALMKSFGKDYLIGAILKFIHDLNLFVGPQFLHLMIVFLRTEDAPLWHGLALTVTIMLSQVVMSLCLRHYFFKVIRENYKKRERWDIMIPFWLLKTYHIFSLFPFLFCFVKCYITGLRVRTAVVLAVYRKALLLSAAERQTKTLGEITNLMSIDAQRLQGM